MKKNMKYIIVLITLIFLSISVVNASDNTTDLTDHTLEKTTTHTTEKIVTSTQEEKIQNENITTKEKTINKKNTAEKTKTTTKEEDISNYNSLKSILTGSDSEYVTINIISNITLEDNTTVNSAIKTLTINGKCDKQFSSPL